MLLYGFNCRGWKGTSGDHLVQIKSDPGTWGECGAVLTNNTALCITCKEIYQFSKITS